MTRSSFRTPPQIRHSVELLPERELTFSGKNKKGFSIEGSLYPLKLHDTYAADFTLMRKGEFEVAQLSNFNPDGVLLPENMNASMGRTLLLYAEMSDDSDPEYLAEKCLGAILQDSGESPPKLTNKGRLFGSPIFEYENATYDPLRHCHILVWLNEHPETLTFATERYHDLMNLLCCRNKILFSYGESRRTNYAARKLYVRLEKQFEGFSYENDSEERRSQMETLLAKMPMPLLEYTRHLRDMNDYATAIKANMRNYEISLRKIQWHSQPKDDLKFLRNFSQKDCRVLLEQIRTNANFLAPGQNLFQQLIASIRGLVEVDTLKQLKENEESSSKRQERLEMLVITIVTMLEGATISATVFPKLPHVFGISSHPGSILFHLAFIGLPLGLIALAIVRIFQQR